MSTGIVQTVGKVAAIEPIGGEMLIMAGDPQDNKLV